MAKKGLLIGALSALGGIVVGVGGVFVYTIISGAKIAKVDYETTWKREEGTRAIMKNYEITKDNTKTAKPYNAKDFKKFFPKDLHKTSSRLTSKDFTYYYKDVYENAANVANALEEFDNVLGWESPLNRTINPVTGNTKVSKYNFGKKGDPWHSEGDIPQDSAFIWFAGGPQGHHNLDQTTLATNIYSRFGRVFTFRQTQHGFLPSRVVIMDYYGDSLAVQNAILLHDKSLLPKKAAGKKIIWDKYKHSDDSSKVLKKIKDLSLETDTALSVIADMPNERLEKLLLAYSMAITKVDADNTLAFRDAIAKKYKDAQGKEQITKFYEGGISYGFSEAVNSALYGEDRLDNNNHVEDGKFAKIIASSNSLRPALKGSLRLSGGMLKKEQEDSYKGESGTVDPVFSLAIQTQKIIFGQMDPLKWLLTKNTIYGTTNKRKTTFANYAKTNMLFTANKDDWNIGDITDKEKDFYKQNNLKFKLIDNNMGHNNTPWKEYYNFMK